MPASKAIVSTLVVLCLCLSPLTTSRAADSIEALTELWAEKLGADTADEVVALYADDAVFWGTSEKTVSTDIQGIRSYFAAGKEKFPGIKAAVENIVTQNFGDLAISTGIFEVRNIVDGEAQWTVPVRFSFVYAKRDGMWKIVNHHSSGMPK